MTDTRTERAAIDRTTIEWVGKVALAVPSLILLTALVSLLPGIDRLIPGSPVTFVAVVSAIVTVAIVALLLSLAPAVATLVRSTLEGPRHVVEDVAAIVQLLVVFVAMIVAHRGLALAIVPLLDELAWAYDLAFLALALPPLAILAARVYVTLEPVAELLAERVMRANDGDEATE